MNTVTVEQDGAMYKLTAGERAFVFASYSTDKDEVGNPAAAAILMSGNFRVGLVSEATLAVVKQRMVELEGDISAYKDKCAAGNARAAASASKERAYDRVNNEGGDGFNPYR